MTPTVTLIRTLFASIRYQRAQAKRKRLADKKRVCHESGRRGEWAVKEQQEAEPCQP